MIIGTKNKQTTMRFTKEKELRDAYLYDTEKVKHKFLYWPVTINGETRWLEEAWIKYRVKKDNLPFWDSYYWCAVEFLNK